MEIQQKLISLRSITLIISYQLFSFSLSEFSNPSCALFVSNAIFILGRSRSKGPTYQPRSQGPSCLPPLVVGRNTLVAAGHVTTQNLGGKKSVGWEGWQSILFGLCDKLCGFQIV